MANTLADAIAFIVENEEGVQLTTEDLIKYEPSDDAQEKANRILQLFIDTLVHNHIKPVGLN